MTMCDSAILAKDYTIHNRAIANELVLLPSIIGHCQMGRSKAINLQDP